MTTSCDPDLIELLHDYGNAYSNRLLETNCAGAVKPTYNSSLNEREQYIKKKYVERLFLQTLPGSKTANKPTQAELDQILYENVETADCGKTLHLIMLGANPNYAQKMFVVTDHAKRHQQLKQMKLILSNGGNKNSPEKDKFTVWRTIRPPHASLSSLSRWQKLSMNHCVTMPKKWQWNLSIAFFSLSCTRVEQFDVVRLSHSSVDEKRNSTFGSSHREIRGEKKRTALVTFLIHQHVGVSTCLHETLSDIVSRTTSYTGIDLF